MPFDSVEDARRTKGASGSTDWPMNSDRERAWDKGAADASIRKWASSDGSGDKDKMDWTKYASVHFWVDPANKEAYGGYKLLFCEVVGGKVDAIWHGVTLCAATMQGARGGVDMPDADRAGVRNKIEAYYAKARDEFNDQTIQVPWASGGKSVRRAWAQFEVKAAADDTGVIEGIASTPSTDRMGDVVDPLGAQFALPLPLLWQHDAEQPIGQVIKAKATKAGIEIVAKVYRGLLPEIDRAWTLIKSGLVRGLSIGFQAREFSFMDDGGIHFTSWDWLELSAVTIPANSEANIQTIKSHDATKARPAPGNDGQRPRTVRINPTAGATATPTSKGKAVKTYTEQIQDAANQRAANVARMGALQKLADEDGGRTMNEQEQQEFDDLDADIAKIDKHLVSLKRLETLNANGATQVDAKANGGAAATADETRGNGSRGKASPVVLGKSQLPPGIGFARYVMCLQQAKGNPMMAAQIAKSRGYAESSPDVFNVLTAEAQGLNLKTAVAGGNTSDTAWAAPLAQYNNLASEFINYLRPRTILGRLQGVRRVPFLVKIPRQTAGASGYWVGEQAGKPLSKLQFDSITMGPTKMATIVVISDELARVSSPSAETVVRDDMAQGLLQFQDQQAFSPGVAGVANTNPASLTYGASAVTSATSGGASGTVANVYTDVLAAVKNLSTANIDTSTAVWIMDPQTALALGTLQTTIGTPAFPDIGVNGGTLLGIPVIVSNNVTHSTSGGGVMILINPSDIILADDGGVTIDASNEASLQMADNPTNSAASLVSMFQTNQIAIRAELYVNYAMRRAASVTYIDQAHYAG